MVYDLIQFPMNFLLYFSLFFIQSYQQIENVELKIERYSLSGDTLILKCSINNGTSTVHSVYLGDGWSTIPYLLNLSLIILENDTLALHIANPFDGYPKTKYEVIKYLSNSQYSNEIIKQTVDYLIDLKLIDDEIYAQKFVYDRLLIKKESKANIISKLLLKGINKTIANDTVNKMYSNEISNKILNDIVQKKLKLLSIKNYSPEKIKTSLFNYLVSKRFSFEDIKKTFIELNFEICDM